MRRTIRAVALASALFLLAPQAHAGTVSGLSVVGGAVHDISAESQITLQGTADFTGDVAARVQVFTDPAGDWPLAREGSPPFSDLVAGFIEETTSLLRFTWRVADWPDVPGHVSFLPGFYWEFTIGGVAFSARILFDVRGNPSGSLESNCMGEPIIECDVVPGSVVTGSVNAAANEVTMTVRKTDLRHPTTGAALAVAGATLAEATLFQGIAGFVTLAVLIPGATADPADMDRPYVLGRHVETALVPAGLTDTDVRDPQNGFLPGSTQGFNSLTGNFSTTVSIASFPPGDYEAVAQACTGGVCGALARTPVTLVP